MARQDLEQPQNYLRAKYLGSLVESYVLRYARKALSERCLMLRLPGRGHRSGGSLTLAAHDGRVLLESQDELVSELLLVGVEVNYLDQPLEDVDVLGVFQSHEGFVEVLLVQPDVPDLLQLLLLEQPPGSTAYVGKSPR